MVNKWLRFDVSKNDFEVGSCRQLQALLPFVSYSLFFIAGFSVKFLVSQRLFFLNV